MLNESTSLVWMCILVAVLGGVGGIGGGLYRRKCRNCPYLDEWVELITFFISGAVSAFGTILILSGAEKILGSNKVPVEGFTLVSLSVVSGFFAMRLIPLIGSKLEKRFEELGLKLSKAEIRVAEMEQRLSVTGNAGREEALYNHLLVYAESVLSNRSQSECAFVISEIEKHIVKFSCRRTLNIYYARLMRMVGDLDGAVKVLRNYIDAASKVGGLDDFERNGIGIAYYNIACYLCLKMSEVREESVELLEIQKNLKEAVKCIPSLADEWQGDPDFSKLSPDFNKYIVI